MNDEGKNQKYSRRGNHGGNWKGSWECQSQQGSLRGRGKGRKKVKGGKLLSQWKKKSSKWNQCKLKKWNQWKNEKVKSQEGDGNG